MTYRCGIAPSMAALGFTPGPPRVICDGCGAVHGVEKRNGMAYAWFLDGKAPPGWLIERDDDERRDYCRECREKRER